MARIESEETARERWTREHRCLSCLTVDDDGVLVDRGHGPFWYCQEHTDALGDAPMVEMRIMIADWYPSELARMGIV